MSAVAVALRNRRKQQEQAGGPGRTKGRIPFVVPQVGRDEKKYIKIIDLRMIATTTITTTAFWLLFLFYNHCGEQRPFSFFFLTAERRMRVS